jgi:putative ABC transport system ATP-binding protein
MGSSGSGKTTLLNLIAGIDRPTSGMLTIDGQDITNLSRSKLAGWRSVYIGYIFQLYNLVPVLTAYENVELPLTYRAKKDTNVSRWLWNWWVSRTVTIITRGS